MPDAPRTDAAAPAARAHLHRTTALVALGGAVGALLRLLAASAEDAAGVPWSTLAVNVTGSLALGVLAGWLGTRPRAPSWVRPLVGTGILGGFTTFSTFAVETSLRLPGELGAAAVYAGLTVVGAVAAAGLGLVVGTLLGSRGGELR